ncbi:MAG: Zn-dependent exopeptidase M28 [Treponema sp.]|jgi:hypothetical protein|nr:Zn-dependent exopeptidase M28 [Treponema sp.]
MDEAFRVFPYSRFHRFIDLAADRFEVLMEVLEEASVPCRVAAMAGRRHVVVDCRGATRTILTAHYDRTPGSPGANDNGAAVFMLVEAARAVIKQGETGATFIFTDKEELSAGEEITDQGSYSLALGLRELGLEAARVFTFDACGAGDTLIISTAAEKLIGENGDSRAAAMLARIHQLRDLALRAARQAHMEQALLLPTPFSDDAGFLRAGIAAQTITVLPRAEAAAFSSLSRTKDEMAAAILTGFPESDRQRIPETWRSLNGTGDSPLRLTPAYWKKVVGFMRAVCEV